MRLLTDSEEEGLLDLLVPGFGRLSGAEAGSVRRRCVRMIRERTGVSAALFCEQSRGVFLAKLALKVLARFRKSTGRRRWIFTSGEADGGQD